MSRCLSQHRKDIKTGRSGDGRVLKLTPGSSTPSVLPFSGLGRLWDVTVDTEGQVLEGPATEPLAQRSVPSNAKAH